jgi:hypothetical protein
MAWFRKDNKVSVKEFLTAIKSGNRNFIDTLKLKETDFHDASFEELMSNTDDVIAGVNRVQKNFSKVYFNIFNNCLIKHHDDGDVKFLFYTVTKDATSIIRFSSELFDQLGPGNFDDNQFTPFTNHQKIKEISSGIYFNDTDEVLHLWFYEDVTFMLQYRISPLQQFSLMVTINAPKIQDHSIRRKGTILDLLHFNIHHILSTEPLRSTKEIVAQKIKFVDYLYSLDKQEFDAFDMITIRIFDSEQLFRTNIQTHVTLFSSTPINADTKIEIAEKMIKMFGKDNSGSAELEVHERDIIEAGTFWTGRTWRFNEQHGLIAKVGSDEKVSYEVRMSDFENAERFNISILAFNELVDLFGTT